MTLTINQLIFKKQKRLKKKKLNRSKALVKCPQRKGVCLKVYITSNTPAPFFGPTQHLSPF